MSTSGTMSGGMQQSMRQSLLFLNSVVVEARERLNKEQLDLERLLRSAVDQSTFFLTVSLAGVLSDEAQSTMLGARSFLDASQHTATEALERLTQMNEALNEAIDLLTEQHSAQAVIDRFTIEQNRGEEALERSTQEHGALDIQDIQELFEKLVCLKARASYMREEYSVWTGHFDETQRQGAPPSARTSMDLRVDCPQVLSIEQSHLEDETLCTICQEMFALGESCKQLPCLHLYHQHCILPWLSYRNSCPVCRYEL